MDTRERVRTFIINNFLFGEERDLKNDSSFLEGGLIDSTGILELVAFLEREFTITVEDEELVPDNLDSINKVTAFLDKKLCVLPLHVPGSVMVSL